MINLYGIPNCGTVKKARAWLEENNIEYSFHNFKKEGLPEENFNRWLKKLGWETLLNKRGMTWRKLDDSVKNKINEKNAIKIMHENTSIIKRPILENGTKLIIGFEENEYNQLS